MRDTDIAVQFMNGKVTDVVQKSGQAHADNILRLKKAEGQLLLWTAELAAAKKAATVSDRQLQQDLNDWLAETDLQELEAVSGAVPAEALP